MLPLKVPSPDDVLGHPYSFLLTELYNPKAFITHAALLDQAFAHCPIFPTAASRRSLDRVSVPVLLVVLSDQLTILALVGRYPANKLMVRGLIYKRWLPRRGHLLPRDPKILWSYEVLARLSTGYSPLEGRLSTCY